jgi:hypothetical protein
MAAPDQDATRRPPRHPGVSEKTEDLVGVLEGNPCQAQVESLVLRAMHRYKPLWRGIHRQPCCWGAM